MAYCVHCGVKLHDSEKKCPLCDTEVFDPADRERAAEKPYPTHTAEQNLQRGSRYLLSLAALLTLAPAALCVLVNLLLTPATLTWAVYPSAALALLFIALAVPILCKKYRTYKSLAIDFVTISAYLFMVERMSGQDRWFFPIALPCFGLATILLSLILFLYRSGKLNKLTAAAAALISAGAFCLVVEIICRAAYGDGIFLIWSPYVLAPCVFLGGAFFLINGNRAIREEFRRRVHF